MHARTKRLVALKHDQSNKRVADPHKMYPGKQEKERVERSSSKRAAVVFVVMLLIAAFSADAFSQDAALAQGDKTKTTFSTPLPDRNDKTKRTFIQSNAKGWKWVTEQCSDPTTDVCAQASIVEVSTECAASAKFF